jgi:hypothetical protein
MNRPRPWPGGGPHLPGGRPKGACRGILPPAGKSCVCGGPLPLVGKSTFTFNTGREVAYRLGQCPRCVTIFWDDA